MAVPRFLLRKLFKRGSLRQVDNGLFAFTLHNPLGTATIIGPPRIVVNGVSHDPEAVEAGPLDLAAIDEEHPFVFAKGDEWELLFMGTLLRGNNRIHVMAESKEFGELDILVEAEEAGTCDLPIREEE